MVQTHTNHMTDSTPSEQAFSAVAAALAPLQPAEAEALLAYMLALVATKYRTGLPASGIKAELAAKVGLAVDGLAGPGRLPEGVAG
jgi:hypothetical protein